MEIKQAIDNLYKVFSKYSSSGMHHCQCGCIDLGDVRKLAAKKLRELEEDDFASYHGSALYTWGDLEHYKHFLPRVLEVHQQKNGRGLIGLSEIVSKLKYAEWENWDKEEVQGIKDFVSADWKNSINNKIINVNSTDIGYYAYFFSVEELLAFWDTASIEVAISNFVRFFYFNGYDLINKGFILGGKSYETAFKYFVSRKALLKSLEREFFRIHDKDEEYAAQVSVVIQMIEQNTIS